MSELKRDGKAAAIVFHLLLELKETSFMLNLATS